VITAARIVLWVVTASFLCAAAGVSGGNREYRIRFAAVVAGKPFACGATYLRLGTTHAAVTPEFLRFYVYGLRLIDANGRETPLALNQDGVWQQRDVAFLSFEGTNGACASGSPQEHEIVIGSAPAADYVAIRFSVGVPQSLDHADATIASSPLNLSDMFWSWRDGYKFFRFDARVRGQGGSTSSFVFHLGSTDCTGSDAGSRCARRNDVSVRLQPFDPARTIVFDVAKLVERADLERANGCMMMAGEACGPELRSLGLSGAPQSVFAVR
jgi:uncharacterized repeat protein (TIGR04052 family)